MNLMAGRSRNKPRGFTLFEVLVALAIVSIALLAALRAAGQGTSNVADLRTRLLAEWVAQNVIAEQQALGEWPPTGLQEGEATQGGLPFRWREEIVSTPNAAFRRINVRVTASADDARTLARMTGFLVNPAVSKSR